MVQKATGKRKTGAPLGNTNRQIHGGAAALEAFRQGKPFSGLAAEVERGVRADLAEGGQPGMTVEIAVGLHTVMRLYWSALSKVAGDGDLKAFDLYSQRYGWLAGAAGRHWELVRKQGADRPLYDYDLEIARLQAEGAEEE